MLSRSCLHSASGCTLHGVKPGFTGTAQARSWSPPMKPPSGLCSGSLPPHSSFQLAPPCTEEFSSIHARTLRAPSLPLPGAWAWPAPSQEWQLQPVVASAHSHLHWASPAASLLHPPLCLLSSVSLSSFPLDLGAEGKQLGEGGGGSTGRCWIWPFLLTQLTGCPHTFLSILSSR